MLGADSTRASSTACWDCNFRRDIGDSFLGVCAWFEAHGKGPNKNIPPALVEKGCKQWKKKQK